ncbi:DUF2971 domain-containing protein [Flavimarina sp. Hel_I_48]|uniref:DUF2971 domain-containing protein n=1 Tax=Flavimarina sp. Hel_I_48 TaxID=1392488 RepID=UPI0004DF6F23|nr:DUF2971 domain-containing protein [Flavimarina sp. Hel_I_48]
MEKFKISESHVMLGLRTAMSNLIISNSFIDKELHNSASLGETIYHYTSLDSFVSILETQTLFSSNINFLNDRKEYEYGVDLIKEVISGFKKDKQNAQILNLLENHLNLIYKSERYITCFSLDGDLLSQWKAYANNGKGVSIGFDTINIEDQCFSQIIGGKLIEYDKERQIKNIKSIISQIILFFETNKPNIDWEGHDYNSVIVHTILDFLREIISSFKHPSFQTEKEFRLEYEINDTWNKHDDEVINFRTTENLIIPYIKLTTQYQDYLQEQRESPDGFPDTFPIKRLPINQIIIGPSLEFKAIKLVLNKLLKKKGYDNIDISSSTIPYRI